MCLLSTCFSPRWRKNTDRPQLGNDKSTMTTQSNRYNTCSACVATVTWLMRRTTGDVLNVPAVNLTELTISARKRDIIVLGRCHWIFAPDCPPTLTTDHQPTPHCSPTISPRRTRDKRNPLNRPGRLGYRLG